MTTVGNRVGNTPHPPTILETALVHNTLVINKPIKPKTSQEQAKPPKIRSATYEVQGTPRSTHVWLGWRVLPEEESVIRYITEAFKHGRTTHTSTRVVTYPVMGGASIPGMPIAVVKPPKEEEKHNAMMYTF